MDGDLLFIGLLGIAAYVMLGVDPVFPLTAAPSTDPTAQAPVGHRDGSADVGRAREQLGNPGGPCGAKAITQLAAQLYGGGAGLLDKPAGNNCDGVAVDIICFQDGAHYDVLKDGGGENGPQWNYAGQIDPARWRQP